MDGFPATFCKYPPTQKIRDNPDCNAVSRDDKGSGMQWTMLTVSNMFSVVSFFVSW